MEITKENITLVTFLKKFTFAEDPDPGTKIVLPMSEFILIASLLRISLDLQKLGRAMK